MHVTVIGGGVVGLATAYYLTKDGADVRVLEARTIGSGASWGNSGWLSPSFAGPVPAKGVMAYTLKAMTKPDSPVYIAPRLDPSLLRWAWRFWRSCNDRAHYEGLHQIARLAARSHALYDQLEADGVEFTMWHDGMLYVAMDRADAEAELAYLRVHEDYGYKLPDRLLLGDELHAHEPLLGPDVDAGFVIAEERHVIPSTLTRGLADAIVRMGGELVEGAEVSAFDRGSGRVTRVSTTAGMFDVDRLLLAAGAWTTPVARLLGVNVPMQAGKGYSFSVRLSRRPVRPVHLSDRKVTLTPFDDRVRVAGTMEVGGINLDLNERRIKAIVNGAKAFLAEWPDEPIEDVWAGLRPMAPDGRPIMGRAPGYENVFVSTGHSMIGVTLAPASGVAMAELILTGTEPDVLRPFATGRLW